MAYKNVNTAAVKIGTVGEPDQDVVTELNDEERIPETAMYALDPLTIEQCRQQTCATEK